MWSTVRLRTSVPGTDRDTPAPLYVLRVVLPLYAVAQFVHILWTARYFGVRGDEQITLEWSLLPVGGVLEATGQDIHPPLFYLVLHFVLLSPLDVIVAGKLLALAMTVGLLCLTPVVARELGFGRRTQEAGLLLTAVSPLLWQYGIIIRPYTMAALLFVACVIAAMRTIRTRSRGARVALVTSLVLLVYVNYLAALCAFLAVNLLYLGWRDRSTTSPKAWVLTQAAGVLPLLPIIGLLLDQTAHAARIQTSAGVASSGVTGVAARLAYWCYGMMTGETLLQPFLLIPLLGAFGAVMISGIGARARLRADVRRALYASVAIALGILVTYVVVASLVFRGELFTAGPARTLMAVPFVSLVLAHVLREKIRSAPRTGVAVAVVISLCWLSAEANEVLGRDYFRTTDAVPRAEIARAVREHAGPGSHVFVDAPFGTDIASMLEREGVSASVIWDRSRDAYRGHLDSVLRGEDTGGVLVRYDRDLTDGASTWFLDRLRSARPGLTESGSYGPTPALVRWLNARAGRSDPAYQVTVHTWPGAASPAPSR